MMSFSDYKGGHRCPTCHFIRNGENCRLNFEITKRDAEERGYEVLSKEHEYKNQNSKLKYKCPEGHEVWIVTGNFRNNNCGCQICNGKSSKAEKEIVEYIKELNVDVIENDRTKIINPLTNRFLELDILIPELNKAIEFNGLYWHSFDERKQIDEIKKEQCKENNIELLVIEEQDWIDDKEKCLDEINEFVKEEYVRKQTT